MAQATNIFEGKDKGALFVRPELLLQPQLVKPLHSVAPRNICGDWWWNLVRKKSYAKNNFHCWACGVHKSDANIKQWLEAHESYKIDLDNCSYELEEIIALCHPCHNYIHAGRLQAIYEKGEIGIDRYRLIMEHGDNTLAFNGLDKKKAWWTEKGVVEQFFPEHIGTWDKWHLVLDGKKYFSPFKSYAEWAEKYGHTAELPKIDFTSK